jgi:hypothetical protein
MSAAVKLEGSIGLEAANLSTLRVLRHLDRVGDLIFASIRKDLSALAKALSKAICWRIEDGQTA